MQQNFVWHGTGARIAGRGGLALCAALMIAAAPAKPSLPLGVTVADIGPLGAAPSPAPASTTAPAPVQVGFVPAPIPDPDAAGPAAAAPAQEARLAPGFFSQKAVFDGDGYAHGSSAESSHNDRVKAAAGLNWSVPVQ